MSEQQIAFWILSAIAVLGALVAVRKRNLVHGAVSYTHLRAPET